MSKAYMKFYGGDYLANTRALSMLEHGAYLLLILEYWERESLPADLASLYRICGAVNHENRKAVSSVIAKFFTLELQDCGNGCVAPSYKHKRLDCELVRMKEFQEKQRMNAAKGVAKRQPKMGKRARESESREKDSLQLYPSLSVVASNATVSPSLASPRGGSLGSGVAREDMPGYAALQEELEIRRRQRGLAEAETPAAMRPLDRRSGNGVDPAATQDAETLQLLASQLAALEKEAQ